jgi:hypothetical protein
MKAAIMKTRIVTRTPTKKPVATLSINARFREGSSASALTVSARTRSSWVNATTTPIAPSAR